MGKTVQLSGFPFGVTDEVVKVFIEGITGKGTVCTLTTKRSKARGRRVYAIIQFNTVEDAELIISLPSQRLWFGTSYLKAWESKFDILPEPIIFENNLKHLTVHFGCQISKEKFSVLWKEVNVSADFSFGQRKIQFFISHRHVEYMLVLSYENIWQVQRHRPRGQSTDYLLIQLFGAPRIYERDANSTGCVSGDPFLNFAKEIDDKWVRATDFTPSCSIGQSSALCLEIPYGSQLPNFHAKFAYYKETESRVELESGSTYSGHQDLVPIVSAPLDVALPYEILFKVNLLVQHGCLSGPSLDNTFYQLVEPRTKNMAFVEHALKKLYHLRECCYEPSRWLDEEYKKYRRSKNPPKSATTPLKDGLVNVHRVQVTPCKVYFSGPEINVSNRVIRNYAEDVNNFLRVSFVDEELGKMFSTDLAPRSSSIDDDRKAKTKVYERIRSVLRNGIIIGDKKFEFLAFSSSQLRENSTWMFASRNGLDAADIREWMGNFRNIRNVAKYAARLGQSFGSSTETLTVDKHEVRLIPDIEVQSAGIDYIFSDGIGKISAKFARKVAFKCGIRKFNPSAFQIRYGGYKGVVAVDPFSSAKLSLRKSMCKYESENNKLDVLSWSKFQPYYLNRQLITLFSTLGVEDHIFEEKQRALIDQLNTIMTNPLKAQEALELMSSGENTNILKEMLKCGYEPNTEPFLSMMLQTFRATKLLDLRKKSRIYVPNGRAMMGCLDETGILEYGQVFVQFSGHRHGHIYDDSIIFSGKISNPCFIVNTEVVVAKNPCLHPGDVRVLEAVDVPALHHMVDCVVFPRKGSRPHPNECSGSDLDGDVYFVCWDPDLIPPERVEPMDYTPVPSVKLDHDVTMEEVQEYFANYMVNDSLGIIANAHVVFADAEPMKAMSRHCIELAKLFSIAVDFPKTGIPALIPRHLHVREYPDFMDKPDKPTYISRNVIGKLFREVEDVAETTSFKSFTRDVAKQSYDPDMEVEGFENYIDDAFHHKSNYDFKLGNLMDFYGIKTEAEILSGISLKKSKFFNKERDTESISMAIRSLRKDARSWFDEKVTGLEFAQNNVYAKASAWYYVTYHHSYWGLYNEGKTCDHFLSFPWCVYDKLIRIKKRKAGNNRAQHRRQ